MTLIFKMFSFLGEFSLKFRRCARSSLVSAAFFDDAAKKTLWAVVEVAGSRFHVLRIRAKLCQIWPLADLFPVDFGLE